MENQKVIKMEERNKSEQRFGDAMENTDGSAIGKILSVGPRKEGHEPELDHDCLKEDESIGADQVFVNFNELISQTQEKDKDKDSSKWLKIKFKGPKEGHCWKGDDEAAAAIENPKEPMVGANDTSMDLNKLSTEALRNYCKHYKIKGVDGRSKRERLLNAMEQHFASYPQLNENEVIPQFVAAAAALSRRQKDK